MDKSTANGRETEAMLRRAMSEHGVDAGGSSNDERVKKLMNGLSPSDAAKVRSILADPEQIKSILATPQAKKLLESLKGKN